MKKLIIFGGSFDPIHEGHIKVAKKAMKKIKASKLFFVPCNQHPDDKKIVATKQERLDMLNLSIQNMPEFEICEYELNIDEPSYTINTVRYFKQNYSNYELYLLIGYDQLIQFNTWNDYEQILDMAKIICHTRKIEKDKIKENVNFPFIKVGFRNINAASRELKTKPNRKFLSQKVIDYINNNAIYVEERFKFVMSDYRLNHCKMVAVLAKDIAIKHKLYPIAEKAYVAGFYHDYAKEFDKNIQIAIAKKMKIKNYPSWKVLHGYVAAYYMQKNFLMDDYQVLTAIKSHTVPYDFSTLSKIIYIADKIAIRDDNENNYRKEWYKIAFKDIDLCFKTITTFYESYYDNKNEEGEKI